MKKFILCADDYSQNEAINGAIIRLAKNHRLSAISCMTNSRSWLDDANALKELKHCDLGVHLNFTHGEPLSQSMKAVYPQFPQSLSRISLDLLKNTLKKHVIYDEICCQLDRFKKALGKNPDFIDGHQHIHHFPRIRQALMDAYHHHYTNEKPYIRVSANRLFEKAFSLKKLAVFLTGAYALKKILAQQGLPHNEYFAGVYNFKPSPSYQTHFEEFIDNIPSRTLIMCHPGLESEAIDDPIASARINEFNFLISDAFSTLLKQNTLSLARFNDKS